ncbi:hypothetical protein BGZ79_005374, partial [Entomortierella chlamydospora]
ELESSLSNPEHYILDSLFHSQQVMNDEFRYLLEREGPFSNPENSMHDSRPHFQQFVGDDPDTWLRLRSQSDYQRPFLHEIRASIHQSSSYEDSCEGSRSDTAPEHMDVEYSKLLRDITHDDVYPMSDPAPSPVPDPAPIPATVLYEGSLFGTAPKNMDVESLNLRDNIHDDIYQFPGTASAVPDPAPGPISVIVTPEEEDYPVFRKG